MALYAGTGVGRISSIESAATRIRALVDDAEGLLTFSPHEATAETSSPVCYVAEFRGGYMGLLENREIAAELRKLASELTALLRVSLAVGENRVNAPPFLRSCYPCAVGALTVAELAESLDGGSVVIHEPAPTASAAEISAETLRHLGTLITRVPEGSIRDALIRLRERLEERH
jgi:hypothetical protein